MKTSNSYLFLFLCLTLFSSQSYSQENRSTKDQSKAPINTLVKKSQYSIKTPIFSQIKAESATNAQAAACSLYGGDVQGNTNISMCFDDGPITLSTVGATTDATYPDIGWGIWLLDDPINGGATGPIPADPNVYDDINFLGVLPTNLGATVSLNPFGDGATYYVAPFVFDRNISAVDITCNGLAPGYTINMNPIVGYSANYNNCTFTVNFSGGYSNVDPNAVFNWSYLDPSGNTVTGSGNPMTFPATENGTYVLSLDNDGGTCSLPDFWTVNVSSCVNLSAKIFLEGPYDNGTMRNDLIQFSTFPITEPYTDLGYFRGNAGSGESLNSVPAALQENIVDWALLELRDASNTDSIVGTKAVLVLEDGQIIDQYGASSINIALADETVEDYIILVRHRNHLSTISDQSCSVNAADCFVDFTTTPNLEGQKSLGNGEYGLVSGSADGNDVIDAEDRSNAWNRRNMTGYLLDDLNMDNVVDAQDRSITWNNRNRIVIFP